MPLKIHFLNVGHGDCTVIEHPSGRISMIDINNGSELDLMSRSEISAVYGSALGLLGIPSSQTILARKEYGVSLTNPVDFFVRVYPGRQIFRYIQTHPDVDHMRGISSLIESGLIPTNFWDTHHRKEPDLQEQDVKDWETYQALRTGNYKKTTILRYQRDSRARYFNQNEDETPGGDHIEILSPTPEIQQWADENEEWNDLSYVLRITHASRTIILGGDAGETAWEGIFHHYGTQLKCDILKASHHGRDSGYYQPAVEAMSPLLTIVSVGKKPDTDASNKYHSYSDNVWSTRWKGTISLEITNEGRIHYETEYKQ